MTSDARWYFDRTSGPDIEHAPSAKYRSLIDLERSLHITASLENDVRTLLPKISSKTTIKFFAEFTLHCT